MRQFTMQLVRTRVYRLVFFSFSAWSSLVFFITALSFFLPSPYNEWGFHPFRTAVPCRGQITYNLSGLSPKRDCGSKGVNLRPGDEPALLVWICPTRPLREWGHRWRMQDGDGRRVSEAPEDPLSIARRTWLCYSYHKLPVAATWRRALCASVCPWLPLFLSISLSKHSSSVY